MAAHPGDLVLFNGDVRAIRDVVAVVAPSVTTLLANAAARQRAQHGAPNAVQPTDQAEILRNRESVLRVALLRQLPVLSNIPDAVAFLERLRPTPLPE